MKQMLFLFVVMSAPRIYGECVRSTERATEYTLLNNQAIQFANDAASFKSRWPEERLRSDKVFRRQFCDSRDDGKNGGAVLAKSGYDIANQLSTLENSQSVDCDGDLEKAAQNARSNSSSFADYIHKTLTASHNCIN